MFQFGFSIDEAHKKWFSTIEEVFSIRVKKAGGVYAAQEKNGRVFVSAACESKNKSELMHVLKECFADMFATVVKYEYLRARIRLPIAAASYTLLLHTLVAFDRENERECIESALTLSDGLALDGVFWFRLRALRARWDEIVSLASENAVYLADEDTLNELIRFLIGAISPKIRRLDVRERDHNYCVRGVLPESDFEYSIFGTEQLLLYLIDIAPLELRLLGHFSDRRLYDKLTRLFDAKRIEGEDRDKQNQKS